MHNIQSSMIWVFNDLLQKPVFSWGGATVYYVGKKNTRKHERKILPGKPYSVNTKWERDTFYFLSYCKLKSLSRISINKQGHFQLKKMGF